MTSLEDDMLVRAIRKKKEVLKELKQILNLRFTDFSSPIFENMNWVDPKNWDGEKTYRIEQITALIKHFKVPLKAAGFDSKAIFKEWRFFKNYVRANYMGVKSLQLWKKIFINKREEYINLCKLASTVVSLLSSNSSVEQAFSLLTLMLSNRCLDMNHTTLQNMILININEKLWTSQESDKLIDCDVQNFSSK